MPGRSQHASESCNRPTGAGFTWLPLVLEQLFSWYTKSTLHCMLLVQPSNINVESFATTQSSQRDQHSPRDILFQTKFSPNAQPLSSVEYFQQSTSQRVTFSLSYPYQKDERPLPGNLHGRKLFCFPTVIIKLQIKIILNCI